MRFETANGTLNGAQGFSNQWFMYEFWRSCSSKRSWAQTALEFPPIQKGASFNLDAVKAKIAEAMGAQAK